MSIMMMRHGRRLASSLVSKSRQIIKYQNDDDLCRNALKDGKYVLFDDKGYRPLTKNNEIDWKTYGEVSEFLNSSPVLLSFDSVGTPLFALSASKLHGTLLDVRTLLIESSSQIENASLLTQGVSLLKWHKRMNYCSNCGSSNLIRNVAGSRYVCSNCSNLIYPNIAPVGIALIRNERNDSLLLVNLHRHPKGMYSCVAGYVDVGESLEDCIVREVAEEIGADVISLSFSSSQHWSFSHGAGLLMLGCSAVVSDTCIPDPLETEVHDARWFTLQEVRALLAGDSEFLIPPQGAIAHQMIHTWIQSHKND